MRRESFTAAADELSLTQSAVSRQVSTLEQLLGVPLLEERGRRKIVLTASGAFYADHIRKMLAELATATAEAIALGGRGRVLRLGIPPTFGSLWLIPRMQSFFEAHPDISVEFSTRIPNRPHPGLEGLHAQIDFAAAPNSNAHWEALMELYLLPVATEQIVQALKSGKKSAISNVHLLIHNTERGRWTELFDHPELAPLRSQATLTFENYTMLLQAAVNGLGIALAPKEFITAELAARNLVPIVDLPIKSQTTAYLVYPQENSSYMPLEAFRNWLHEIIN